MNFYADDLLGFYDNSPATEGFRDDIVSGGTNRFLTWVFNFLDQIIRVISNLITRFMGIPSAPEDLLNIGMINMAKIKSYIMQMKTLFDGVMQTNQLDVATSQRLIDAFSEYQSSDLYQRIHQYQPTEGTKYVDVPKNLEREIKSNMIEVRNILTKVRTSARTRYANYQREYKPIPADEQSLFSMLQVACSCFMGVVAKIRNPGKVGQSGDVVISGGVDVRF